ncbi:hypothetical protein [Magnetospirillum sp. UT-4]|uniref:hypothetical protein n=1 Tax=Magnetospirillum sp. UT-4 TaxID=2681467 RepID=UPI0013806745|nr:hypothetical protein [Magnetospirillum sp. UT-4]CAA7620133.1 conserved hypothetical protein [Magnetospirillum sp. UT-4]
MIDVQYVTAQSKFSLEVFKVVRPHVPRERWPANPLRATFMPHPDGLYLEGSFDDLPGAYAQVAQRAVIQAGVELVRVSPVAFWAAEVVRAKRWRDAFMFFAVPLLFAIPLMGALHQSAMILAAGAFAVNLVVLIFTQGLLIRRRATLASARFVAEIPVPGMRLAVAATRQKAGLGEDGSPG